jgi:hypothetical protein
MKAFISIALVIVLIVVAVLIYDYIQESKLVGFLEFRKNMKAEFPEVWLVSVSNPTNPTIDITIGLKKSYKNEDVDAMFLKVIEYLNNEASYNSLQNLHKSRFRNSADRITISFEYKKGDKSIISYYKASTEMGGDNFPFDSFKYWGLFYQGEYIKTYELPEK